MNKNTHREPILYIVGNKERQDEIRNILEDKWGGGGYDGLKCDNNKMAYYINTMGYISFCDVNFSMFRESVANGWLKEYKLPEKPQFKPFDKVVVRSAKRCLWKAAFYSHKGSTGHMMTSSYEYKYCLPYDEQTEKLIGTYNEWKGEYNE